MSKRVLHIIDSLGWTGVASQVLTLSRGLTEKGFDVHVAALDGFATRADEFRTAGIAITELRRRARIDPLAFLRLQRLVKRVRPDIVHTWNFEAGVWGHAAATFAGATGMVVGQYHIDPWVGSWRRLIDRHRAEKASVFVANSPEIRRWCEGQGWPAEKFQVIPPGIPPAPASDVSRDELLRELQVPPNAKLIGVIGRLIPEKRVKDLIWAADLLRVLHDNLRLLVIGDGILRPVLEQYARLASDLDHIRFLGERDHAWRIVPHLDVLWNASENRSHSIALLEAMAAGVPAIASDTPINREAVVENEAGYLVPPLERAGRATRARHTDRIFADAELRRALAEKSQSRCAKEFSAHRMVDQYFDLYQSVGNA